MVVVYKKFSAATTKERTLIRSGVHPNFGRESGKGTLFGCTSHITI
jgi:hypothetical protein